MAAVLVMGGYSVSLPRDSEVTRAADNENPFRLEMNWTGASSPPILTRHLLRASSRFRACSYGRALAHVLPGKMFDGISKDDCRDAGKIFDNGSRLNDFDRML